MGRRESCRKTTDHVPYVEMGQDCMCYECHLLQSWSVHGCLLETEMCRDSWRTEWADSFIEISALSHVFLLFLMPLCHGIANVRNSSSGPGQPAEHFSGRMPFPKPKQSCATGSNIVKTSSAVAQESPFSPPTQLCVLPQAEQVQETVTLCDCRLNLSYFTQNCLSE